MHVVHEGKRYPEVWLGLPEMHSGIYVRHDIVRTISFHCAKGADETYVLSISIGVATRSLGLRRHVEGPKALGMSVRMFEELKVCRS